ncbi:fructose-bisphosphate aldolase (plasmid) [Arthrobacter sp. ERGS1:01]|uniref:class II fructose-bisphosphate aldolase n=1 Tax=Arthrobacter sp. ERGS1:01 TaxID=1704044 RepID=UPI0006B57ACD|nr:class II fructose-bisphosphate aldolase [Arthrobacter sp. ERGS1:01]ALE04804.1 fructose-bisphosphate aldolase [Arthrobacter sp. ERGS1:01]
MPLVHTGDLITAAIRRQAGIAAFNIITLEHAEAIVTAAEAAQAPVILQISQNTVRFHGGHLRPLAAAANAIGELSSVPVALHLDHVDDIDLLKASVDAGICSAMFDSGSLPYSENVERTRAAVRWAHGHGLWLEAELGYIGGKPNQPQSAHADGVRTDPAEALLFTEATGVDALAVAVGSSHAMNTKSASLDVDLINRLHARLPVPLVLHGSSGVPDTELRAAIAAGIVKVNIGTALNGAMSATIRSILTADPALVDPRRYLGPARADMSQTVETLIRLINQSRKDAETTLR